MPLGKALLRLAVGGCCMAFASPASAFRVLADRPEFAGETQVRWPVRAVPFEVSGDVPADLRVEDVIANAGRALARWSNVACADFEFTVAAISASRASSGDGANTIQLLDTGWASRGFDPDAAGATDLIVRERTAGGWEISEADIYINAEHHRWSPAETPADGYRSLMSVIVHEGGHALGLTHPCEPEGVDGAPACSAAGGEERVSVMYPFYGAGQAELLPDDVDGLCHLYPRCEAEGCANGFACTASGCVPVCGEGICRPSELCVSGECVPADECPGRACPDCGDEGCGAETCSVDDDCETGTCLSDGTCAVTCGDDTACSAEHVCVSSPRGGYCSPRGSVETGMPCREAEQCAGNQCLAGIEAEPVCTKTCVNHEDCPSGWGCSDIQGRDVCAPFSAGGGCSVTRPQPIPSRAHELICAALAACVLLRVAPRRQRSHAR